MEYSAFEEFFRLAEAVTELDFMQHPELLEPAIAALPEGIAQQRTREIVNWLCLEQLFLAREDAAFEEEMRRFFDQAFAEKTARIEALERSGAESAEKQTETAAELARLTGALNAAEQAAAQAGTLQAQNTAYERDNAALRRELQNAKQEIRRLEKELARGKDAVQKTPGELVLDVTESSLEECEEKLRHMTPEEKAKIRRIHFVGSLAHFPDIEKFPELHTLEFDEIMVFAASRIRLCPKLQRLIFHTKDTILALFGMEFSVREIQAIPGGSIEDFAGWNGIAFTAIGQ